MPPRLTLTTDFGTGSHYVAQLKGAVWSVCPDAEIVDLTHDIPAQDVTYAGWFLARTIPFFPVGTHHLAIIDPGVGTGRDIILAQWQSQVILGPDNGLFAPLWRRHAPTWIRRVTNTRWWSPRPSATFHGRDIMAPVIGRLLRGDSATDAGPVVELSQTDDSFAPTGEPMGEKRTAEVHGHVVAIDKFGNLLTDIPAASIPRTVRSAYWTIGNTIHGPLDHVQTYADRASGNLVALVGSEGEWELAVVNGNAAQRIAALRSETVHVTW